MRARPWRRRGPPRPGLGAILVGLVDDPHVARARHADVGEVERIAPGDARVDRRDAVGRSGQDDMPAGALSVGRRHSGPVRRLGVDGRSARERGPRDAVVAHADLARLGVDAARVAGDPEGVLEDDEVDPGPVDDRVRRERDDDRSAAAERYDVGAPAPRTAPDGRSLDDPRHRRRAEARALGGVERHDPRDEPVRRERDAGLAVAPGFAGDGSTVATLRDVRRGGVMGPQSRVGVVRPRR